MRRRAAIGNNRVTTTAAKRWRIAACLVLFCLTLRPWNAQSQGDTPARALLPAPVWVYNDWSAYDELSDNVPLTEKLAMRELDQVLRLRALGVRFDYYVMDAFWYDPNGGYRTWRKDDWPNGPDQWLAVLKANGVKPGLWFSTNTLLHMEPASKWRDSLTTSQTAMALYRGGFLPDFMDVMDYWYDRGVRLFKFDMADFDAVASADEGRITTREARLKNLVAFHSALQGFRRKHPDVVLVGFNGLVGDIGSEATPVRPLNARWLDVFDSFYSGDPRPSNIPAMNFWRSVDVYSDQMVRSFEQAGIPLSRIDSTNVMLGDTGTNYHREKRAWRSSLLLMVSHGGWLNTVHGNLEFLDDADARWLAKVQQIYDPLQRKGVTKSFGGIPGDGYPYGFGSVSEEGVIYTVVNPSQRMRTVRLPQLAPFQPRLEDGRVLFHDSGFDPPLGKSSIRLGPEQLALIGFGDYAGPQYDLGTEEDVRVPRHIERLPVNFKRLASGQAGQPAEALEASFPAPEAGGLRITLRQLDHDDDVMRSVTDKKMGDHFKIAAWQDGKPIPIEVHYDKVIWSGLAWGVGEIRSENLIRGEPILVRLSGADNDPALHIEGRVYQVEY